MNVKTKKSKVLVGGGIAGLLVIALVSVIVTNGRNSGTIPLYSSVEEGRALSKGQKDKCLIDSSTAAENISKDDEIEEFEYEGQKTQYTLFETVVVSGFRDIPAGTNGEVAKNSYDGGIAKGSVVYDQDYGSYNYEARKTQGPEQWELVSLTACEM